MLQLNLKQRVRRCIDYALQDNPTAIIVGRDELDEATRLVGDNPVIVCQAGPMFAQFLVRYSQMLSEQAGVKRKRK